MAKVGWRLKSYDLRPSEISQLMNCARGCSRMNMMNALAIMNGMEACSVKGGYTLERFKFNSA